MTSFKVATFNIRHGLGVDGVLSLERTAAVIERTGADIIGIQEMDRFWKRSGDVDQAEELARLTGMHISFHPTFARCRSEYGIGILSRQPLETDYTPLPQADGEEPRGLLSVPLNEISVLVTHLSRSSSARPPQIEALLQVAETVPPPVVIMGDFNDTRRGLKRIFEAGFTPGTKRVTTLPRHGWGREIDLIFAGRGAKVRATHTLTSAASDHLALVADIDL